MDCVLVERHSWVVDTADGGEGVVPTPVRTAAAGNRTRLALPTEPPHIPPNWVNQITEEITG